jgi:cytochrome c oxidase assembly protein subunit 15
LFLGADVTSLKVGMADPVWPTYPWHLALVSWPDSGLGFLIEHGHRAVGYLVGMCVIVLALGLWFAQPRRLLKWLGLMALAAVIGQGLLGGFRVRLNALAGTDLALVHGCFAQLVFALFTCLVTLTSPDWDEPVFSRPANDSDRLRFWSASTAALVFAQLLLGGVVRHTHVLFGPRGHLLLAFAVIGAAIRLAHVIHERRPVDRHLARLATLLLILTGLQVLLGVESWMLRFGAGPLADFRPATFAQALVRTGHFLAGSGIFATAVVVALWAYRASLANFDRASRTACRVEGAI